MTLKRIVIKEELLQLTGDYKKAIILNQFLYWTERVKDYDKFISEEMKRSNLEDKELNIDLTNGWIYKKADELSKETMLGLSNSNISVHIKSLLDNGWLHKRRNPNRNWDKTLQYRVDIIKVISDLHKIGYALEGYPLLNKYIKGMKDENIEIPETENRISKTEIRGSKIEIHNSEIENRISKTEEQYHRLHTENTNIDYITNSSTSEGQNIEEENSEFIDKILGIKVSDSQKRIINTLDKVRLEKSALITSSYMGKASDELYRILVATYNNDNNHRERNTVVTSERKKSGVKFNNFTPRKNNFEEIEGKLLGWDD